MGLGQVIFEAMEEEESHLEKHDTLVRPIHLPALRLPVCSKLLSYVRIGLFVDWSLWYCIWNRRWTITIDSYLANCSTQNAFSAPVNAIFHLVVKFTSYALSTITNENLEIYCFLWYKCFHHVCHGYYSTGPWNPGGTFDLPCKDLCHIINTLQSPWKMTNSICSIIFRYLSHLSI